MKVYPVTPLSKQYIELKSEQILTKFDREHLCIPKPLNVAKLIDCFLDDEYGWSLDVRNDLPQDILGLTNPENKTISMPEVDYEKLVAGDGRARFTGCHEFGHVVLHGKQLVMKAVTLNPKTAHLFRTERTNLKPYQDPEWQADYIAGALLMPQQSLLEFVRTYKGTDLINAIANTYNVSYSAAEVRQRKVRG